MKSAADRRVVVTGIGAISALGHSLRDSWLACRAGHSAIRIHEMSAGECGPPPFKVPLALVAGDPVAALESVLGRRIGGSLDPFALYALIAATEAISDAGLQREQLADAGVVFGHGIGGMHTIESTYERFFGRRSARMHPLTVPRIMVSSAVSAITIEYGIHGPGFAVASACASSGHAISQAAMLIQSGLADVVITGGADAIATPGSIAGWSGLHAISASTCRPFSRERDGMAIGEGAGALVLESYSHAQRRGAALRAEVAGFGMSSDASHWTQPDLAGAVSCMRMACKAAGIGPDTRMLISTHGTGTVLNDRNESQAIHSVFGAHAGSQVVIATKSSHGHLIGASTAVQSALALRALELGVAPPVLNYLGPDPECDLDLVLGAAREVSCEALLVNSFSFGGLNSSIIFRPIGT